MLYPAELRERGFPHNLRFTVVRGVLTDLVGLLVVWRPDTIGGPLELLEYWEDPEAVPKASGSQSV